MKLSENFSLAELTRSEAAIRKGIDNTAPPEVIENLKALCLNVLQPLRNAVGAIQVNSGYRGAAVNKAIGGSKASQHMTGQAADIEWTGGNYELGKKIIELGLPFDQIIFEFGTPTAPAWIHVSYSARNRRQVLRATNSGGGTKYIPFAP